MMTVEGTVEKKEPGRSNLAVRAISALILGPLVLILVFLGGWPFVGLVLVLAVVSLLEFCELGRGQEIPGNTVIGLVALIFLLIAYAVGQISWLLILFPITGVTVFALETLRGTQPLSRRWGRVAVTLGGLAYAGLPSAFLMVIRALPDALIWFAFIICVTWGTDTLAYFGGRFWGKHKLAPRISPKKTVEGAVVGLIFGFAAGIVVLALSGKLSTGTVILALLAPPLAVIGDLFESVLKRFFNVKDSHLAHLNIIPGHGGVLDRTDSLIWVTTLCYLYLVLSGG
ncbi:MAG: phosphatidate cytidylyltransferase [Chloroflexota bacterium]